MNILYTCDNNYVWLMGISTISLFENNKHISELTVYLLGENITIQNKKILSEIANKYSRSIAIIEVPKIDIPNSLVSARWPLSAFTRLYSGQLLPDSLDRVLYLDCDTIISGDISQLDDIDISRKVVYGVKDCVGSLYKKNIGIKGNDVYINAGVLLFNLKKLREIDINGIVDEYMAEYERTINYADQDILNGIFRGKIGILNPKYNMMTIDVVYSYKEIQKLRKPTNFYSSEEIEDAKSNAVIIHYTTNMRIIRPWYANTDHPLAEEFIYYMKISPWKNIELKEFVCTSKEQRVIGLINKLPRNMAIRILGFMHSKFKPLYIWMRSKC